MGTKFETWRIDVGDELMRKNMVSASHFRANNHESVPCGLSPELAEPLLIKGRDIAALLFGTFLTSFAVMTFEVALTRIFSVMFSYHYAFLTLAVALAGLGLGGIAARAVFSDATTRKKVF